MEWYTLYTLFYRIYTFYIYIYLWNVYILRHPQQLYSVFLNKTLQQVTDIDVTTTEAASSQQPLASSDFLKGHGYFPPKGANWRDSGQFRSLRLILILMSGYGHDRDVETW